MGRSKDLSNNDLVAKDETVTSRINPGLEVRSSVFDHTLRNSGAIGSLKNHAVPQRPH